LLRYLHLSVQDVSLVRSLLQRHSRYTGSPKAKALLSDWKTTQAHFVKIFPHEYRRALGEAEKTKVHLASSST
jgi:glutamate synthase domain-containing protein 3